MAAWIKGMGDGILSRGGAKPGDKTMLDAWVPAGKAAVLAGGDGADERAVLQAAADAARAGRDETATFESRRGRSAKLGARSLGHIDPGAASAALILAAMLKTRNARGMRTRRLSPAQCWPASGLQAGHCLDEGGGRRPGIGVAKRAHPALCIGV